MKADSYNMKIPFKILEEEKINIFLSGFEPNNFVKKVCSSIQHVGVLNQIHLFCG